MPPPPSAYLRLKGDRLRMQPPVSWPESPCPNPAGPTLSTAYIDDAKAVLHGTAADPPPFHKTIVVTHDQVRLDLLQCVQCHADDNQKPCPAKVVLHIGALDQDVRQDCHHRKEDRPRQRD